MCTQTYTCEQEQFCIMGVEGFEIAVGQAVGMAIGVAWIPSIVSLHEGILNRSKTIKIFEKVENLQFSNFSNVFK